MEHSNFGHLYLVGIGPGDPELITYKAGRILTQTKVWAVPHARSVDVSSALQIAGSLIDPSDKTIVELTFSMKKVFLGTAVDTSLMDAWETSAKAVLHYLEKGEDVVFPTLGDVTLYSTAFYLLSLIQEKRPEVQVTAVPGITAMSACAAGISTPLSLGNDVLCVVPAAFDDDRLTTILNTMDAVVLMKVHRKINQLIQLLTDLGLIDQAILFERFGLPGQRIYTDIREAAEKKLHYFSTILIRKKQLQLYQ